MSQAEELAKTKTTRKPLSGRSTPWVCSVGDYRRKLGLTQQDVCDACGITKAALSVIEHGTDPLLTTASRLAAFFDVPVSDLWRLR